MRKMLIFDGCKTINKVVVTVVPLIGYCSQYRLIRANAAVGSFSIDVCAILLIANILRIVFWFTNGFALNLLIQSFLIIIIEVHWNCFSLQLSNFVSTWVIKIMMILGMWGSGAGITLVVLVWLLSYVSDVFAGVHYCFVSHHIF